MRLPLLLVIWHIEIYRNNFFSSLNGDLAYTWSPALHFKRRIVSSHVYCAVKNFLLIEQLYQQFGRKTTSP